MGFVAGYLLGVVSATLVILAIDMWQKNREDKRKKPPMGFKRSE